MADINPEALSGSRAPSAQRTSRSPGAGTDCDLITLVELLFFAYRDFTREADVVLGEFGLGRAHHRVLHFVNHHPGLRVADLLDVLKITKQSLARVLKQLVDEGWIHQRTGARDRRQRLLFPTEKGAALSARLDGLQAKRVAHALASTGRGSDAIVRRFLFAMIAKEERAMVEALLPAPIEASDGAGQ
jgi:DNA-binding MarR family transcriptional regulator